MATTRNAELSRRATRDVLADHLELRQRGDLEADLMRNYHPNVVTISAEGVNHGHDAIRYLAGVLHSYVTDGDYRYHRLQTDGDVGMLVWSAQTGSLHVHDGADTFLIRDGQIVVQTIHYTTYRPDQSAG